MKNRLRLSYNSPVILTFVLICFVVTCLNYITGGRSNTLLFMTYHSSLRNPLTYIRFFTHIFGHANWEHFINNSIYLLLLGPVLEEKYGSSQVITVIGVTAVVTGLVNYIFFPNVALCGASGVAFAFILLVSFTGFTDHTIPITFILVAVLFLGEQIYDGITLQDNVSQLTHIIGGVIGAVCGFVFNRSAVRSQKDVKEKTDH